MFGVWAAPAALKARPTCGGLSAPYFGKVLGAAGPSRPQESTSSGRPDNHALWQLGRQRLLNAPCTGRLTSDRQRDAPWCKSQIHGLKKPRQKAKRCNMDHTAHTWHDVPLSIMVFKTKGTAGLQTKPQGQYQVPGEGVSRTFRTIHCCLCVVSVWRFGCRHV